MAPANTPELEATYRGQRDGTSGASEEIVTDTSTEPPEGVQATIAADFEGRHYARLRAIMHCAKRPLWAQSPLTDELEACDGEGIVSIEDHGVYTTPVVENADATGSDRTRYAYRVQWEPGIACEDDRYRWHYLGRIGAPGGA